MGTIATLRKISKLAMRGVTRGDKARAFLLAGFPMIGDHRVKIKQWWYRGINKLCANDQLVISLRMKGRTLKFAMRKDNAGDYMIGGELIAMVYKRPPFTPEKIIDAGANIGMFSVLANLYFPNTFIECYEPDAGNFRQLEINLKLNGIHADAHQKGVWSKDITLYFHEQTSQSGYIDENPPGIPIACILPKVSKSSWIKLDIEGSEYEVLPAILNQATYPKTISMEVHHMKERGDFLLNVLKSKGYKIIPHSDDKEDCYVLDAVLI